MGKNINIDIYSHTYSNLTQQQVIFIRGTLSSLSVYKVVSRQGVVTHNKPLLKQ